MDEFARVILKLQPGQIEQVNGILLAAHRDYLVIEQQNLEQHTDNLGHVVTIIKPVPLAKLEDQLWTQLDQVFDSQQQSIARLNLKLDPPEVQPPISLSDLVRPGLLGWGKHGARIELWRVGVWFHWKVQTRGYESSARAPELPAEYRRFWKEPDHLTRVTGVVTLDGQPLADAEVSFHGVEELRFNTKTNVDGTFLIAAPSQGRIPTGDYRVAIAKPGLREEYASPETSGLMVKVILGSNELRFELSMSP